MKRVAGVATSPNVALERSSRAFDECFAVPADRGSFVSLLRRHFSRSPPALSVGTDAGVKLPVARDVNASVKDFRTSVAQENYTHPVQELQADRGRQLEMKQYALGNLFGSHMPLRLQMEQFYLSRPLRLPGLRSEFSGLKTVLDEDEEFGFEDYLNDSEFADVRVDIHAAMETRLFGRPL